MLGFGENTTLNGISSRTWLDFSVFRPIFAYRSYLEMERHFPKISSSRFWTLSRLFIKSFLLIIFASGTMFFLETLGEMPFFEENGFAHLYQCDNGTISKIYSKECSSETWSVMFSFYFTIVVNLDKIFIRLSDEVCILKV